MYSERYVIQTERIFLRHRRSGATIDRVSVLFGSVSNTLQELDAYDSVPERGKVVDLNASSRASESVRYGVEVALSVLDSQSTPSSVRGGNACSVRRSVGRS